MKEKYRDVQKLTDNPFLNLYHIDAVDTDGKDFNYYFASRNKENNIKLKTHDVRPEGIVIYLSLIHISEPTRLQRSSRMPSSA